MLLKYVGNFTAIMNIVQVHLRKSMQSLFRGLERQILIAPPSFRMRGKWRARKFQGKNVAKEGESERSGAELANHATRSKLSLSGVDCKWVGTRQQ